MADEKGNINYEVTVSLKKLGAAVREQYDLDKLDLANFGIYIHGVPEDTRLPETVQSLPGVPAYMTVPIACGIIQAHD